MRRRGRRPTVILGECTGRNAERIAGMGWGRMKIARPWDPYPGEPWAIDNAAYRFWSKGEPYDWSLLDRSVAEAERLVLEEGKSPPIFGVVPDLVAAGRASLAFSLAWIDRWRARHFPGGGLAPGDPTDPLAPWRRLVVPWFLAVQDGMTPADVEREHRGLPAICYFEGILLGGTTAWKYATARQWRALIDRWGGRFHYARAGTAKKLYHAYQVGADSVDSALPMRSLQMWAAYERAWRGLDAEQLGFLEDHAGSA